MVTGSLELKAVNPAESLLEVEGAAWVHLRLANGTGITIYPGHAPLLAETVTASIRYADERGEHVFEAEAGILKVDGSQVTVFTSGSSELEAVPEPSPVPEQRRFQRLAQELRNRLENEPNAVLPKRLNGDRE